MRKPDEIMAEYLLKGGKMLSRTCPDCGSPLFEVQGVTLCVVCRENEAGQGGPDPGSDPLIQSEGSVMMQPGQIKKENTRTGLREEFEETIRILLRKAAAEEDTARLNALMQAVKVAAESYSLLGQEYGSRDNS